MRYKWCTYMPSLSSTYYRNTSGVIYIRHIIIIIKKHRICWKNLINGWKNSINGRKMLEKYDKNVGNCRKNLINCRKNSISWINCFNAVVEKLFRQGGSLVWRHPMWLSEKLLGFCISVASGTPGIRNSPVSRTPRRHFKTWITPWKVAKMKNGSR